MAEAPRDENRVKAKLGVLFSDGETLIPIKISASTNAMQLNTTDTVDPGILAEYEAGKPIPRDANHQPAWCAVSSADPNIVFPIFVDADGSVLVDM